MQNVINSVAEFPAESPVQSPEEEAKFVDSLSKGLQDILSCKQPTASELLEAVQAIFGWAARWYFRQQIDTLRREVEPATPLGQYFSTVLAQEHIEAALLGRAKPDKQYQSTLDLLYHRSAAYRTTEAFQEMVSFVAKFRDYAPYNNFLVKIQNPSCSFFATERDWGNRFQRTIKEDARPMLILAPMHPVMAVYDLDSTDGPELPEHFVPNVKKGEKWSDVVLHRTIENARRDQILVQFKTLSSTHRGTVIIGSQDPMFKMRVVIHDRLEKLAQYVVLCHELAHIYLGHLGSDEDGRWPSRTGLDGATLEMEAEAVAFIVSSRCDLDAGSEKFISSYKCDRLPETLSLDLISKVAGKLESMGRAVHTPRKTKQKPVSR